MKNIVLGSAFVVWGIGYILGCTDASTYETEPEIHPWESKNVISTVILNGMPKNYILPEIVSEQNTNMELPQYLQEQSMTSVKGGAFIISTGVYEQGRYCLYSLARKSEKYFLSYPGHLDYPGMAEKTKRILYATSLLRLRPDNKAFVCADCHSGMVEICSVENLEIDSICRYCFYYPQLEIREKNNISMILYKEEKFCCRDISVSEKRIYALYSYRVNSREDDSSVQQFLLELDWQGNLLASFRVDRPVAHLHFDASNGMLYGYIYEKENTVFVRFNM